MRALRLKVDLGGWRQEERQATTVQVSVREDRSNSPVFTGVGVAILAPEDYHEGDDTVKRARVGVALALLRALVDSQMPVEYACEVADAVRGALDKRSARKIGEAYWRVSKRVVLPCTLCGVKH